MHEKKNKINKTLDWEFNFKKTLKLLIVIDLGFYKHSHPLLPMLQTIFEIAIIKVYRNIKHLDKMDFVSKSYEQVMNTNQVDLNITN